jgi:hypothetical protein
MIKEKALPQLSWNQLTRWRSECGQRFGSVYDLPVRKYGEAVREWLKPEQRVLDVGAGVNKPFKKAFIQPPQEYFSLDSDPEGEFDFRTIEDIPADVKFDLVVANQVLEHLTIAQTFEVLCGAELHLVPGGVFFANVPNTSHPVRQWDPTHITPWPMSDLYSMFRNAGFEVISMARYNKYPLTRNPLKRFIVRTVCQTFRVDWCDSLIIVGQKPEK